MYKKIDVYVNGIYQYTTTKFKRCKDAIRDARQTKHIIIASVPKNKYLTIYDYDKVTAHFSR